MKYQIVSTVTGAFFPKGVRLFLENLEIALAYDGNVTYRSTDLIDVTGLLDVVCRVTGWNGTPWTLVLDVTIPGDSAYRKTISVARTIVAKQTDLYVAAIDLTQ